ncbi:MAG: hypothetical protein NW226_08075 [Microscillaceae bacterium]|nr:hypothetical protein [Microscillaceae bacterium]
MEQSSEFDKDPFARQRNTKKTIPAEKQTASGNPFKPVSIQTKAQKNNHQIAQAKLDTFAQQNDHQIAQAKIQSKTAGNPFSDLQAKMSLGHPPIIQASPDQEKSLGENTAQDWLKNAELAVQEGKLRFYSMPADIEGNASFVMFDDFYVNKAFRYIFKQWFGVSISESMENFSGSEVAPPWVGEFRARAMNLRDRKPDESDYQSYVEQKRLADIALRLADVVSSLSPAQLFRKEFVKETDKSVGKLVMSQADIDNERKKPAEGGVTPANFTTCILFFGQVSTKVMGSLGLKKAILSGPNAYKEINSAAKESLPPGAWCPCTKDSRPKPGDLIISNFAENVMDDKNPKVVKYYKGYFAHISILRYIEPNQADSKYTEKWISVDGGGTNAQLVTRYFDPETCLIKGPGTILRKMHGWIDIEKVAEHNLPKTTSV